MKEKINLIGISGKINSGKDLVGSIIQYLTYCKDNNSRMAYSSYLLLRSPISVWQIKKFADKLKDMVCLMIGCTREDLEDNDFKNKELGEEWTKYHLGGNNYTIDEKDWMYLHRSHDRSTYDKITRQNIVKLTPRLLLQQLGTDTCRNIHSNCWVNALFADYKDLPKVANSGIHGESKGYCMSSWIVTDTRFVNEADAIKNRGGINMRIDRHIQLSDFKEGFIYQMKDRFADGTVKSKIDYDNANWKTYIFEESDRPYIERMIYGTNVKNGLLGLRFEPNKHESETALDNYKFDEVIDNNSTIEDLIKKVKVILIKYKII